MRPLKMPVAPLAMLAAIACVAAGQASAAQMTDAERDALLLKASQAMRANAQLPEALSEGLSWTNVRADLGADALVFDYEIAGSLEAHEAEILAGTPKQVALACSDPAMRDALERGISYQYRYRSTTDNEVRTTGIKPGDCRAGSKG